ncbi:unnamed protein product [Brassica napus]|uniref:(rape) hypothetical protein n=1 Tax=Brassica napus TaxID=3708 RepID=A0A816VYP3_BRANA|nr:unnamed protein product [Brassica napus]
MLSNLSEITVYERKKLGENNIEFPEDILHSSFLTYKLHLSFNNILGVLPKTLANISQLDTLDLRNNSLSAFVLPDSIFVNVFVEVVKGLKKLNERLHFENNTGLLMTFLV